MSKLATSLALDGSEIFLLIFGLLVAVGVWGEQTKSKWKKWLRTFEVFVVIGVAGEFLADGFIFVLSRHLQTISDNQLAAAIIQAGAANVLAQGAAVEAAGLKANAESLRKEAEDERSERIKIEEAVAWRRLTKFQISEMGKALAAFPKQLTALVYNVNDLEAYSFASDIDVALHEFAKWNVGEPQAILKMREGPVNFGTNPPLERGVIVRSTSDERSRAAAKAVIHELYIRGFDASPGEPSRNPRPAVEISVEPRPEGPQGEAKLRQQHKAAASAQAKHF